MLLNKTPSLNGLEEVVEEAIVESILKILGGD